MFCPHCGNEFENVGGVCPYCNAVIEDAAPLTTEAPAKSGNKGKLFLLIGGIAALALVIVLVLFLFGGGADGVAQDYQQAQLDGDLATMYDCTPLNLDFDELCERAKPIDADDYKSDKYAYESLTKALKEADDPADFEEVMELYKTNEENLEYEYNENGIVSSFEFVEREYENVRVRISDEISVNDDGFEELVESYNDSIESMRKRLGSNKDLLAEAEISMGDIDEAKVVFVAYEVDSEKEGYDHTWINSFLVVKVNGSWKVLTTGCIDELFDFAGLYEDSKSDIDIDVY